MIAGILNHATGSLTGVVDTPRLDAEVLLAHLLGTERGGLIAREDDSITTDLQRTYDTLIERRRGGEPLAYILGYRDFWTLRLEVNAHVLVPRPETELLVELALGHLRGTARPTVLDLGTGSGAIGLAIAAERPDARVMLADASPEALAVAGRNRARLRCDTVTLHQSDWFNGLPVEAFDVIVSNPPYLGDQDPHLQDPALRREPPMALVSGTSGLEALALIAATAGSRLAAGGALFLEHGATQGEAVRGLLSGAGFRAVTTHRDLAGLERATGGLRQD